MTDDDGARSPRPTGGRGIGAWLSRGITRLRESAWAARLRRSPLAGYIPGRVLRRWLFAVLVIALASLTFGVTTATATGNLGPHQARYSVTLDHEVTIDLGPLGTVVFDSPGPPVLGARVVVQEIPREITSVASGTTLDALSRDLERYVQFFTGPEATVQVAVRALIMDAARRSVVAAVVLTAAALGLRVLLGSRRRAELRAQLAPHRGVIAGTTAVSLLVVLGLTSSLPRGPEDLASRASPVFDGTPLEGARITGRLAGVVETYGTYVIDAYRENQRFYAQATDAVHTAWVQQLEREARIEQLRDDLTPPADGPAEDENAPDGAGDDGAPGPRGPEEQGAPDADDAPDEAEADDGDASGAGDADPPDADQAPPVVLLVISDLHCNVGMAPAIETVVELSGAQMVLNAGDTSVNGTAVESYCMTALANAIPGAVMVMASGNHDSQETEAQARGVGAEVLDGEVVAVHGVRILGDADPRATRIGEGTYLRGDETLAELSERLAEAACAEDPDLLLIHDPLAGTGALESGCVPAQVSGHYHRRADPHWLGTGVRYVSASTAGAALGQPTIGPLNGIAELTVLRFDPEQRRIVDYRLVRVLPDASATVGPPLRWPSGPPQIRPDSPIQ